MENLRQYKTHNAIVLIAWQLAILILAGGTAYALRLVMEDVLALIIGGAIAVFGILFVSMGLASKMLAPTEFLAMAILHVSSEQSGTPAPNIKSIKASRDFMERLASYVYDMASKSVMSQYPVANTTSTVSDTSMATQAMPDFLQGTPLPFFVVNKDMVITALSQSAVTYLAESEDKILGKPVYDALKLSFSSDDTLDNWLQFSREKSVTGVRTWDRVKLTLANGTLRQLDLAARYSRDDARGQELVIALFDHTEKYGKDDAGASFVSMAVHELRTPLTIMRGYIEVFEDELTDKLDAEQREFLRNLSAQAQQLGSFVSNIQNLARIEENALELQLKQEQWPEVLSGVLNDMEIRAKVRHKELKHEIPADLPAVAVDRVTIYEVLVNIIENAIKYTHTDAPITVRASLKDQNWVETTIEDHGIGIPDSLLGHIFDKFYRSHRTSKSVGGTGLGLYIAKTIVEAHGGQVWVKTKEGEGSTFGFTIPTYESVANQVNSSDNAIERRAHGWIKNHTLYRG